MTMNEVAGGTRSPYRNLWIILALLIPAALLAFAKTYSKGLTFSNMTVTPMIHVHTALMVLWLFMLIGQAWFVATKRYKAHRWVGRSSYVIVPVIIVMTLLVDHEFFNRRMPEIPTLDARFMIYDWLQIFGFGLAWALGLAYRNRTPIHVRFMVSTVLAMGNAIVFRIIVNWFAWVPALNVVDNPDNIEHVAFANGAVLVSMMLALIAMDWRLGIERSPFWLVTATTLLIHIGFFTFTKSDWWMNLVQWYANLPL